MKRCQLWVSGLASLIVLLAAHAPAAHAYVGWSIGFRVGGPVYGRPYYGYYGAPYYYAPPPVVYAAPPVIYAAPPVVYVPAPIVARQPAYSAEYAPAPSVVPVPAAPSITQTSVVPVRNESAAANSQGDALLAKLKDASETVRRDAAMDLGRMKAQHAIDSLTTMLSKDTSSIARDGAARALGLIGASRSLNALIYAAQADADRDVRHSAQFAVEVIRTNLRGN
jgi:hypothetical protein